MDHEDRAPGWAVPFLAAHAVATSAPHYLRQLDETSFARTARGCDHFILLTTLPGFVGAVALLPATSGLLLLLGSSLWGIVTLLTVGRRVSLERRRRRDRAVR
jgi:hypothetical protein